MTVFKTLQLTEHIGQHTLGGRHTHAAHQALRVLLRRTDTMVADVQSRLHDGQNENMMSTVIADVLDAARQRYALDNELSMERLATIRSRYATEHEHASIAAYPDIPDVAWSIHGYGSGYPGLDHQLQYNMDILYVSNLTVRDDDLQRRVSALYDGLTENLLEHVVDEQRTQHMAIDNILYVYLTEYGDGAAYYEQLIHYVIKNAAQHEYKIVLHMGWIRMLMVSFLVDTMESLRAEHEGAPEAWLGTLMKHELPSVDRFVTAVQNLGDVMFSRYSMHDEL